MGRARVLALASQVVARLPYGPWVTFVTSPAQYVEHVQFAVRLFGESLAERTVQYGEARARRETWSSLATGAAHYRSRGGDDIARLFEALAEVLGVAERSN